MYIQVVKQNFIMQFTLRPLEDGIRDLETPLGSTVILFKGWPSSDLDLYYGKVKFGNLGFSIGKSENTFWNYCSQWPETDGFNEDMWVLKVKVISWPWPKVVYIQKFKPDFLRNYCVYLNQTLYENFQVQGNENLMTWCWSHDQDGRHAHIW